MSNPEIIVNILTQALSSTVHGPDFNLCLSLLREPSVCPSGISKEGLTNRQSYMIPMEMREMED
jgi:hypothetical protein